MNRILATSVALVSSLFCAAAAKADTAGIGFAAPGPLLNNASGYSLGYQFTAKTDVTITALGYFDDGGLLEVHQVGLYSSRGELLSSTTVDGSGLQDGFFNYSAIAPVTLRAGHTYQVMGNSGVLDNYTFNTDGFVVNPAITLDRDAFALGNFLQFGKQTEEIDVAHGGAFFGANFEIAAQTPEPGSLFLLCGGLPGLLAVARRRAKTLA